jgi:hypothetical protein
MSINVVDKVPSISAFSGRVYRPKLPAGGFSRIDISAQFVRFVATRLNAIEHRSTIDARRSWREDSRPSQSAIPSEAKHRRDTRRTENV